MHGLSPVQGISTNRPVLLELGSQNAKLPSALPVFTTTQSKKRHKMPEHASPKQSQQTPRKAHALFFAAIPPAEIHAQMASAWQSFGTSAPFRHDTLHLSLYGIAEMGDLDPILIQRASQAATRVRTAPFTLCFDRLMTFNGQPENAPLVAATDGANNKPQEIAAELHAALRTLGITASQSQKINPHVTLAYGPGFSGERHLTKPIIWTISEITLIDSLQGQGRHLSLGQWPLPKNREQPSFDF